MKPNLSHADFDRLVQVVADANAAADLKDEQLQRIETALDLDLIAIEDYRVELERYREAITHLEDLLERGPISRDRLEEIVREARGR